MCGICGIAGQEDPALIKKMCKSLHHRGPDDSGIYSDDHITLGHTRLSIIDLEKGHQPIHNEDESIWIVFNGEIYNFKELKRQLSDHEFYTETDTEVIVHLYEEHGLDFVNKLNGMFAFALWDSKKELLLLARDPIGKKPLYYNLDQDNLTFASEIKAILKSDVIKKEINLEALCSYLAYLYVQGDQTLFKNIKKLPGGHLLIFNKNEVTIKKYWDINENINDINGKDSIKYLRKLLEKSGEYRAISDVEIGCFLSGGLDSSVTSALVNPNLDYDLHTFSVGFENFSEFEFSRTVSEHLDATNHELIIYPSTFLNELEKITWHNDEPIGDAAIINNYYISNLAKKYVKVVIAGESGDELFGGYNNYKINLKLDNLFKIPIINHLMEKIINVYPKNGNIYQNKYKWILNNYLPYFCQNMDIAHLNSTRSIRDNEMEWLTNIKCKDIEKKAIYPNKVHDPLNRMLALDVKNLLPERYLMKADKTTMAHSIEQRLPLMDINIVNFVFSLPGKFKIKNGVEKYILKMAVKDLLPSKIINRDKMGYGTPLNDWILDKELKSCIINQFNESPLLNKIIKKEKIKLFENQLKKNDNRRSNIIWSLFALGIWYDTYFSEFN
ncbi:MAG: asparagine synthase (glutamine-hydrolyzing) [Methanobacterium sp.]